MPVSKASLFSESENQLAIIGRALSHPARIRIFNLIKEHGFVRNCDLIVQLGLTGTSVTNHVRKLQEAKLVQIDYSPNHFQISLRRNELNSITNFLDEL